MHPYVQERLSLNYELAISYLTNRLRKYIEYAGAKGGVVGISGGIDSSVTSFILARAIGINRSFFLLMPSDSTPKRDIEHAIEILNILGVKENWKLINIDEIVDKFKKVLDENDKRITGNIKARVRMILLYSFAQRFNYLVIGTGDKSELLLGYFTKYGDGGVDVLPIGDLYKTQVRSLGKYLGVPEEIVKKPPSPALWEGQTAEGEIGVDYETIDSILYLRFEEFRETKEISEMLGVSEDVVNRIDKMVRSSQHKRSLPEIFRVSKRAINSDLRYPREWFYL
jgi:NAD+ synthetase